MICIIFLAVAAQVAAGQDAPLLEQLDREMQSLYQEVQQSVVRVQLPPPAWVEELLADEHPATRWEQLDPEVRRRLVEQHPGRRGGRLSTAILAPTTQPHDPGTHDGLVADGNWRLTPSDQDHSLRMESLQRGDRQVIVIAPPGASDQQAHVRIETRPQSGFTSANLALIIDDQGHLVVPVYLEREQFGRPVPVQLGGGRSTVATFVGSDRQIGLTVLKLDQPTGKAARIASLHRPARGSLVMILSPTNDTARLSVWTDNAREWGVVVSVDGQVAGFARHGQFLAASAVVPVVEQLVRAGEINRPQLGLVVVEIGPDDALRQQRSLGDQPGLHVRRVIGGSPAEKAGLQADDIILRLGDAPVGDIPMFAAALTVQKRVVTLTIQREGQIRTVDVHLTE